MGDFYLATREDLHLVTHGDLLMAMCIFLAVIRRRMYQCRHSVPYAVSTYA
jgi:hypothetical protein